MGGRRCRDRDCEHASFLDHVTMLASLSEALTAARSDEIATIQAALREYRVVGVTGGAEVGKSTLLRSALARYAEPGDIPVVAVDLAGVYSPRHLARRWLRAVERAVAGPIASSHIAVLPEAMWPSSTRRAAHRVREAVASSREALDEADERRGKGSIEDVAVGIDATARLATRTRGPVVLAVDHLEAPELARSLSVRDVLWHVRTMSQEHSNVQVVLACRSAGVSVATDEKGAFYGDGTWLTIETPGPEVWRRLDASVGLDDALDLTDSHIWSTLLLIDRLQRSSRLSARRAFNALVAEHHDLVARAVQHSAALHAAGPAMLVAIANRRGPYEALTDLPTRDIAVAARRMELAGLIERSRPRVWRIVSPIVAAALREERPLSSDPLR